LSCEEILRQNIERSVAIDMGTRSVSEARTNSVVIRLIGWFQFVDRRRNFVDPLSNEFAN
jgi:hypothetical protein